MQKILFPVFLKQLGEDLTKIKLIIIIRKLMEYRSLKFPKVSIGLPVYNGEKYLDKTLENLLGQSFTKL